MKYSVLMSIYYKEKPQNLIESIESMINQSIKPNQIVIVKDGPLTEELDNVLKLYKQKYGKILDYIELKNNVGLGPALNIGLRKCKNELIARMDTDDISLPDRCEKQLQRFKEDNDLAIIGSAVDEFINSVQNIVSSRKVPRTTEEIMKFAAKRNPFNHPSVMFKKSVIQECGGYKEFLLYEDYDLWLRVLKNGFKCENIEESLVLMRTDDSLYKRRGGVKYCINNIKLRWYIYNKLNMSSFRVWITTTIAHAIVALLPSKIRKVFYLKALR